MRINYESLRAKYYMAKAYRPPNESRSTDVIIELRYGTVLNTKTTVMTEPKEHVCGKKTHNPFTMDVISSFPVYPSRAMPRLPSPGRTEKI